MRVLSNFYYITNIFDLHKFENETAALLFSIFFFFSICWDMHFVPLFFLNKRNMTTFLLMKHLKCTVVHYTSLNWSSKNKRFLSYRSLNMSFLFFDFLFMFILMKLLSKYLWNNYNFFINFFFNKNFQNSCITQSPLLIYNIVRGAGQFLATESPWKIVKNTFYFILTNWIFHWQIRFCTYYTFSLNHVSNIRELWKYWPLKDGFCLILQKLYSATILRWVDQKTSNVPKYLTH